MFFFIKKKHILDIRFGDDWSGLGAGNGFLGSPGVFGDAFHDFPRGFDDISDLAISDLSIGIFNSS